MFGELIGYGDYGFVFEDETEINGPDGAVIKIMTLDTPGWECNTQQYNLFAQLMNHQDQGIRTLGLPYIFKHFRGQMDITLLNILSYMSKETDPRAVRALRESIPVGSEYAVVMMEKLPCVATNQYCGRDLKDKGNIAEEQSVYEHMVTYLYESGWWVRDVIDPRNVGYNLHGEPVWFDPMVARRQGFPGYSADAIEQCHEEVAAYPSSYRKAVQDGSYFKQRHGYGLFHSETQTSKELLHKAKNWPYIKSFVPEREIDARTWEGGYYKSPEHQIRMGNRIKILNSWEDLDPDDIGRPGAWYYVNFPLTVYRGSQKIGVGKRHGNAIDYEIYLEHEYIKPNRLGYNMGYTDVIATSPYLHEALNYEISGGGTETELYSFDIEDYVVTFPRPSQPKNWSEGNDYGKPVVMITGGVSFDDATLLWSRDMKGNIYHAESFVSQDYPQCYLCGLPAKIEVGTALGMRNFCGNKCRGEYEGVDYGPDDYYISPKLEHQLEVVKYHPGYLQDHEADLEANVKIKCRNCPLDINYEFHNCHVKLRKDWHLHRDEEDNLLDHEEIGYCEHEMEVIKYISNDYEWSGTAVIRCKKCNLADEIMADIPEGCGNRGRDKPKWFGSAEDYEIRRWLKVLRDDDPDWDDIDWTDPPEKIDDSWHDEIEWNAWEAESNPVSERDQLEQYIGVEASIKEHMTGNHHPPFSINFNVGNVFNRRHNKIMGVSQDLPKWNPRSIGFTE